MFIVGVARWPLPYALKNNRPYFRPVREIRVSEQVQHSLRDFLPTCRFDRPVFGQFHHFPGNPRRTEITSTDLPPEGIEQRRRDPRNHDENEGGGEAKDPRLFAIE